MSDYFHSWKRRLGVVTLLMACLIMTGWIRSREICDSLKFSTISHTSLESCRGCLAWIYDGDPILPAWTFTYPFCQVSDPASDFRPVIHMCDFEITWSLKMLGFGIGKIVAPPYALRQTWSPKILQIPYWSIILPLALLSVYLLLSKPLAKSEPPQTCPKNIDTPNSPTADKSIALAVKLAPA